MPSRRTFLYGSLGVVAAGSLAVSLPGGGPQTFFGGIPPQVDFAPPGAQLAPEVLRGELDWLVETLREVAARPFLYTDRAAFDERHARTRADIREPMDASRFYLAIAPLFASLNDGHASIAPGRTLDNYIDRGGVLFPLVPSFDGDRVFVGASADARIPRGSEVLSIEGVNAREIVRDMLAVTGGQTMSLRRAFAAGHALEYLYARFGAKSAFAVSARLPDGARIAERVRSANFETLQRAAVKADAGSAHPYAFRRIADGRVGVIDYNSCEDAPRFHAFLEATFAQIKAHPVEGLIIDIRRNGGGDSSLNNDLWSYAQGKAFSQGGKISERISSRIKREYGFAKYNGLYPLGWFLPNGMLFTFDATRFTTVNPGPNALRYHGPVYLLIGPGTFSSAQLCALAAKDYGLATLVGEATGEPANSTGEVYVGYTPHTGVSFSFPTKYFWAPKPHPDGQGVLPDVTIVPTSDDRRAGRDPVFAYAVRRIIGA